jgi:hypothetical protein
MHMLQRVRCPECGGTVTGVLRVGDSWPKHKSTAKPLGCPYPNSGGAVLREANFLPDVPFPEQDRHLINDLIQALRKASET